MAKKGTTTVEYRSGNPNETGVTSGSSHAGHQTTDSTNPSDPTRGVGNPFLKHTQQNHPAPPSEPKGLSGATLIDMAPIRNLLHTQMRRILLHPEEQTGDVKNRYLSLRQALDQIDLYELQHDTPLEELLNITWHTTRHKNDPEETPPATE